MKVKLTVLSMLVVGLLAFGSSTATAMPAAAAPTTASLPLTITGLTCTTTGTTTSAPCTLTAELVRFTSQGGQLFAVVNATLTNLTSGVSTTTQILLPVTQATGTCTILDLTIGPIHLDLLGLVVDTNAIHLKITAEQGPGNLLGNLLCAVAHLLDSQTSASGLSRLLNQILGGLAL